MEVFAEVMEKGVTPATVLVGLLGNVLSICVLRKKEIQVRAAVILQQGVCPLGGMTSDKTVLIC